MDLSKCWKPVSAPGRIQWELHWIFMGFRNSRHPFPMYLIPAGLAQPVLPALCYLHANEKSLSVTGGPEGGETCDPPTLHSLA